MRFGGVRARTRLIIKVLGVSNNVIYFKENALQKAFLIFIGTY